MHTTIRRNNCGHSGIILLVIIVIVFVVALPFLKGIAASYLDAKMNAKHLSLWVSMQPVTALLSEYREKHQAYPLNLQQLSAAYNNISFDELLYTKNKYSFNYRYGLLSDNFELRLEPESPKDDDIYLYSDKSRTVHVSQKGPAGPDDQEIGQFIDYNRQNSFHLNKWSIKKPKE